MRFSCSARGPFDLVGKEEPQFPGENPGDRRSPQLGHTRLSYTHTVHLNVVSPW